jgi:hypothetical protein
MKEQVGFVKKGFFFKLFFPLPLRKSSKMGLEIEFFRMVYVASAGRRPRFGRSP